MKAVLFGATGLVGAEAFRLLAEDQRFNETLVITRRKLSPFHFHRMVPCVADFNSLAKISSVITSFKAEVAFCCLGTTRAKAGSKEAFYQVDHDLIVSLAQTCRDAGIKTFGLISSVGADACSKNFYLRVKGETERDVQALGFKRLVILRPSLLLGKRMENRPAERIAMTFAPLYNPLLIGPLKRYRAVHAETVAKTMIHLCLVSLEGVTVCEGEGFNLNHN